jgi:hypothetical protein
MGKRMSSDNKGFIGQLFDSRDAADHERKAIKQDHKAASTRDTTDAKAAKAAAGHRAQAQKLRDGK